MPGVIQVGSKNTLSATFDVSAKTISILGVTACDLTQADLQYVYDTTTSAVIYSPSLQTCTGMVRTWVEGSPVFTYSFRRLPAGVANGDTIIVYIQIPTDLINFFRNATGGGGAPLNSPAFTGIPTAPTGDLGDNSTQIATDAFVQQELDAATIVFGDTFTGAGTIADPLEATGSTPGGSNTEIQYNNSGAFEGAAIYTDGTQLGINKAPTVALDLKQLINGSEVFFNVDNFTGDASIFSAKYVGFLGSIVITGMGNDGIRISADEVKITSTFESIHQSSFKAFAGGVIPVTVYTYEAGQTGNLLQFVGDSEVPTAYVGPKGTFSPAGFTVATLPTAAKGMHAYVTDALTPAYNVTVVGGGAVAIPVFYNGSTWVCH